MPVTPATPSVTRSSTATASATASATLTANTTASTTATGTFTATPSGVPSPTRTPSGTLTPNAPFGAGSFVLSVVGDGIVSIPVLTREVTVPVTLRVYADCGAGCTGGPALQRVVPINALNGLDAYGNRPLTVSGSSTTAGFSPNVPAVNPYGLTTYRATHRMGKLVRSDNKGMVTLTGFDVWAGFDFTAGKREPTVGYLSWRGDIKVSTPCKQLRQLNSNNTINDPYYCDGCVYGFRCTPWYAVTVPQCPPYSPTQMPSTSQHPSPRPRSFNNAELPLAFATVDGSLFYWSGAQIPTSAPYGLRSWAPTQISQSTVIAGLQLRNDYDMVRVVDGALWFFTVAGGPVSAGLAAAPYAMVSALYRTPLPSATAVDASFAAATPLITGTGGDIWADFDVEAANSVWVAANTGLLNYRLTEDGVWALARFPSPAELISVALSNDRATLYVVSAASDSNASALYAFVVATATYVNGGAPILLPPSGYAFRGVAPAPVQPSASATATPTRSASGSLTASVTASASATQVSLTATPSGTPPSTPSITATASSEWGPRQQHGCLRASRRARA